MPTVADLRAAINRDADLTSGEYADDVNAAISAAERYCARFPFYFNETRDETFVTVNGQEWYDESDNANIPTLVHIEAVYSEDSDGKRTPLTRQHPTWMETVSDGTASTGAPTDWTYFGQRIRLYRIPGSEVFTIRLQLSPYRLTPLDTGDDADTNAWLTEAYDLIKARAKYILQKDSLKDAALAVEALNDFQDWLNALTDETAKRTGTGFLMPTEF
jgi:hypothetical protein